MRVILCGAAASGKTFLKDRLLKKGVRRVISSTTRPIREGEVDGEDYDFLSEKEFNTLKSTGFFYETQEFNGWQYGTRRMDWHSGGLFIMTPGGIAQITRIERKKCFIIYLDIDEDIRKLRLSKREDADSVERRLKADEEDFRDFTDYDLRVTNVDF